MARHTFTWHYVHPWHYVHAWHTCARAYAGVAVQFRGNIWPSTTSGPHFDRNADRHHPHSHALSGSVVSLD